MASSHWVLVIVELVTADHKPLPLQYKSYIHSEP